MVGTEKKQALADYWKQTFEVSHVDFDPVAADNFASQFFAPLPTITSSPIDVECVSTLLSRAKNTQPGPDGIGFSAWRHAGNFATQTLAQAAVDLCGGTTPHDDFNSSIMVSPRKKPHGWRIADRC